MSSESLYVLDKFSDSARVASLKARLEKVRERAKKAGRDVKDLENRIKRLRKQRKKSRRAGDTISLPTRRMTQAEILATQTIGIRG